MEKVQPVRVTLSHLGGSTAQSGKPREVEGCEEKYEGIKQVWNS